MSARPRLPRPLTVAQILSSAAGALPMLIAAVRMDPAVFTSFSIITLASALAALERICATVSGRGSLGRALISPPLEPRLRDWRRRPRH